MSYSKPSKPFCSIAIVVMCSEVTVQKAPVTFGQLKLLNRNSSIGHWGLERYEQIHYELGSINKFNGQILGHIATIEIEVFKTCLLLL